MIESTEFVKVVRVSSNLVEQLSEEWSRPVQVRITKRIDHGDGEELELLFRDIEDARALGYIP